MRLTSRVLVLPVALAAGVLVSCDSPTRAPTLGRIEPRFVIVNDAKSTASLVALDGMRATITAPGSSTAIDFTTLTPPATPSGQWTGSIPGVAPGSYQLTVEGTVGGAIQHYGRSTNNITVVAGQAASAPLVIAPVVPTIPTFAVADTNVFAQVVTLGTSFTLATGWEYQLSQNAGFTGATIVTVNGATPTFTVTVTDIGTWHLRSRPVLPFKTATEVIWSDPQTFVITPSTGGRSSANAINAGLISGVPDTIVDRNITSALTEGWYLFPARAGDSLFAETRAQRLTPASPLNSTIALFRADGTTPVAGAVITDDIAGSTDSRAVAVAPATENYLVRVGRAGGTVGHYDLVLELRRLPAAPTGVAAIATSATAVRVRWNDVADNETSYRIERCLGATCTDFAEVGTAAANDTSFAETGLTAGSTYRYRVRARNAIGNSAFVGPVLVALQGPTAPAGLTATTISGSRIDLAWNDLSDNETGFEIERCGAADCSAGPFVAVTTVPAGTQAYSNTGLAVDGTYTYRVRATNNVAPSAYSNTATANTIRPAAPLTLAASTISAAQIDLAWSDTSSIETGFSIERCATAGCSNFAEIGTVGANVTSYSDLTVVPETFYSYRVRATNVAGASNASNTALANTRAPGVPASFAATVVSASRVDLSWSDTTVAETGFQVERCEGAGCSGFGALASVIAGSTGYSDITVAVGASYRYRVRATGVAGNSTEAGPVLAAVLLPAPPTGLVAATASGTQVNLSWTDASDNETTFRIERCTGAACTDFAEIGFVTAGTAAYNDLSAIVENDYRYQVRARNSVGNSVYTAIASASTRTAAAPSTLAATQVSATQIDLAWTDNAGNETGFSIERCSGVACSNFAEVATVGANVVTYQNTGVGAGTSYSYRVRALNAVAASAPSNVATTSTTVPTAPTTLSATTVSGARIDLVWTDESSDEQGFTVERCTGTACEDFAQVGAALPAGSTAFQDLGVAASTDYRYRVRAFNAVGPSAYSAPTSANTRLPSVPSALSAVTVSGARIDLTWSDASNNETGFVLERCAGTGCSFVVLDTTAAGVTTFSDVTVAVDVSYTYRVNAFNGVGASAYSGTAISNTFLPVAPSALSAQTVSPTSIALEWTNNAPEANGFIVERCTGGGCSDFAAIDSTAGGATAYSDLSAQPGNLYGYRVRARNVSGRSAPSAPAVASTIVPAAPTALIAETRSDTRIDLAWTDASGDEIGFRIERCTGGSCTDFVVVDSVASDMTVYVNEGLTAAQTYRYRVLAFNAAGGSAYTNIAAASTNLPAIPTGLAGEALTATQVDLSWTDNSTDELGFSIERCVGAGCSDFAEIATTAPAATTFSDAAAIAGDVNRYRIRAFNGAGNSGYSEIVTVTTTVPADPTGAAAVPVGTTAIDVSWIDASDNETRFVIERCTGAGCGAFAPIDSVPAGTNSFTDPTVAAGQTYRYRIIARNALGSSQPSASVEVNTILPDAPTNLSAATVSSTRIDLAWDDNATNETGYELERCQGAACSDFARIDSLPPNTSAYSDAALTPNLSYRYRLRAINGVGGSAYSAIVDATTNVPADPTSLAATATSTTSISLIWTDNSDNETQFVIQRCPAAACADLDFSDLAAVAPNVTTYVDGTLSLNDVATYRVRAVNDNGTSRYTNVATASVTTPTPSSAFAAQNIDANRIGLSWTDDATNETGFEIERCTGAGCSDFTRLDSLGANVTSLVDSNTVLDESYSYRVRAINRVGTSAYTGPETANTLRPSAPSGLAAATISATQVDLGWTDNAFNEVGYAVERCTGSTCSDFALLLNVPSDAVAYSDLSAVVGQEYRYRIRSYNVAGTSAYDGPVSASTLLPATPTALGAVVTAPTEITLAWTDNASNEASFRLERCSGAGCNTFVQIATVPQDGTQYVDAGLVSNTFYRYRVRAANTAGFSAYSAIASPNTFAPAPPTSLAANTLFGDRIDLNWADAASNETGFRIERCTGTACSDFAEVATVGANVTTHADSTLTFGTTYRFRVRSYNGVANSGYSEAVEGNTNVPLDPTALTAGAQSTTRIDLAWTDNGTNETGYRVERCETPGCTTFAVIATLAANSTTYSDTPIAAATSFTYRVVAFNQGSSGYSNPATATTILPAAPTGAAAVAVSGDRVDLSWVDNADNETGFQIERCGGVACSDFAPVATTAADAQAFSDLGLTPGLTYRYRIRAVNGAGTSAYTSEVQGATVVPGIPTALTATTFSADRIDLAWVDNASDELGFVIERCTGTGCSGFTPIDSVETPGATAYQNTGLAAGTTFRYRVRAYNASGVSGVSNVATAGTNTPAAPSTLEAVTIAATRIDLTWTDNADNEGNVRVERCTGASCTDFIEIATLPIDAQAYSDLSVVVNTTYRYRVRATNNAGASAYTPEVVVDTDVPATPTAFAATTISATRIALAWTDVADNETGVRVERCVGLGCADFTELANLPAGAQDYSDEGLTPNESYTYRLFATNPAGASAAAGPVTATTEIPADPTGLTATTISANRIDLSWTDNSSNELAFIIERCDDPTCTLGPTLQTSVGANVTTYSDQTAVLGFRYGYRVSAQNAAGTSAAATAIGSTLLPADPVTTSIVITAATSIAISWNDASDNEDGFVVERCRGVDCTDFSPLTSVGADLVAFEDTGLDGGQSYSYRVRATNAAGSSSPSATLTTALVVPEAPSKLDAVTLSATQARITWLDNATNETGFVIERCQGAGCSDFAVIATVEADSSSYQVDDLVFDESYTFRVWATNPIAGSAYSDPATTTTSLAAPATGLTAVVVAPTQINLAWTDNSAIEDGFLIERCVGVSCSDFEQVAVTARNVTSVGDPTVSLNNVYSYRIRPFNAVGPSAYGNTATETTLLPAAPTLVSATPMTVNRIDLVWTDNAANETLYQVEQCVGAGCTNFSIVAALGANVTTYSWTDATPNTAHRLRVRAIRLNVGASAFATTADLSTVLNIPIVTSAVAYDRNRVDVTWIDNSSIETAYQVVACGGVACSPSVLVGTLPANTTTFSYSGLLAGFSYSWSVRAVSNGTQTALTPAAGVWTPAVMNSGTTIGAITDTLWAQRHYVINVPAGTPELRVTMSGGTGDADLYVRQGLAATLTTFNCRPFIGGNTESCIISNPAAGDWFIMVRGFNAFSDVSLKTSLSTRFGYPTAFGGSGPWSPNFLIGSQVTISQAITMTHLGLQVAGGTGGVRIGLYTNNGSIPGTLVAQASGIIGTTGLLEFPTANVSIAAGTYWVMYNFQNTITRNMDIGSPITVNYITLNYGTALPATYPTVAYNSLFFPGGWRSYTGDLANSFARGYP
jgi:large repetitive protein